MKFYVFVVPASNRRPENLAATAFATLSQPPAGNGGPPLWMAARAGRVSNILRSVLIEHHERADLKR
jgi:hypothetical protein